ncbi:MAG TPA: ClpXP protease specificity-enhancing factor [Rhizobacter sp.]|nr:ClpXP protease specificity-enhancing factor [Rhizobacter sp.]
MSLIPTTPGNAGSSTRPYLIRALHDWCTDNGFTPYLAVYVDASVQVPMEYVKNNEIVLNVGFEATTALKLGNELIEFKARFGGTSRDIVVPVDHVIAIYARENGQGMAFPVPTETSAGSESPLPPVSAVPAERPTQPGGLRLASAEGAGASEGKASALDGETEPPEPPSGGRPSLKRIK